MTIRLPSNQRVERDWWMCAYNKILHNWELKSVQEDFSWLSATAVLNASWKLEQILHSIEPLEHKRIVNYR